MRFEPQLASLDHRINSYLQPPHWFVAAVMNLAMVTAAQWHGEFIAHFAAERWALRKAHVVGIRWLPATDQARLLGDEPDVIAIADPSRLREGKHALIDGFGASFPNRPQGIAPGARF